MLTVNAPEARAVMSVFIINNPMTKTSRPRKHGWFREIGSEQEQKKLAGSFGTQAVNNTDYKD